jgi:hypothetical protein
MIAGGLMAQTGARYLVIANDYFYDAIQPLAQWKTKKGMLCTVVKTSQTGSSNTQIRNFIVNAYNTWNPRPEFVLLVGGGAYLASNAKGWGPYSIRTDNPYASITGDYRAELPYGRLPCNSVRQCSVMVAKTLDYERTPDMGDTNWYHHATTVCRDSTDNDAPTYWSDIRTVINEAVANGFSSFDSLSSSRLQDSLDIRQSVNNGTAFVLYRGRASDNWYTPFDMRSYLGGLTNDRRLPIVCSFTCQTISLDNYYDSMTGNTWVKAGTVTNPCGAVACVGNTHSAISVAGQRSAMTRGFFAGVFTESLLTLGNAVLRGKLQLYNEYHDSMDYMGFNLLGDPELNVWTTVPRAMQVIHEAYVPMGPVTFTVSVAKSGSALCNALVCIRSNSGIYQYGYTDASGQISFSIDPTVEEMMDVTVTARNCIPYEGQAEIYDPAAIAAPAAARRKPETALTVSPNPGRAHFAISAQPGAEVSIHSSDGRLVWTGAMPAAGALNWDASNMPAGVYLVQSVSGAGATVRRTLQVVR